MASTVPAKTQPLHNFALPHLKWKNNHPRGRSASSSSPHHQSRSQSQSPSHSMSPMREPPVQSPMREPPRHSPLRGAGGDAVSEREGLVKSKTSVEYKRTPRSSSKNGVHTSDHDRVVEKSGKRLSSEPDQINNNTNSNTNNSNNESISNSIHNKESRSRFLIKITSGSGLRKSGNKGADEAIQEEKKGEEEEEEEEPMGKTWNLRPRKPIRKSLNVSGGGGCAMKIGGGTAVQENRAQSAQANLNSIGNRNRAEAGELSCGAERKEKRVRFSLPLSREEIEEDIYALTGSKPARRPKKRAKIVQKQLDNLFPGLWLASITPDLYKVPENPTKG